MKATIIGGGIAGLTMALAFEKLGMEYELYEKAETLNEVGAGIWVSSNALQVYNWLGIADSLIEKGIVLRHVDVVDNKFEIITRTNQQLLQEKLGFGTLSIHRALLQETLYKLLPKHKIHFGYELTSIDDGETTMANFKNGASIHSDLLIGADGINSMVRQNHFPPSEQRPTNQICWRGVANYQLPEPFIDSCLESWGKQVRFGFSVISPNQVYWFAVSSKDNKANATPQELLDIFSDFHPIVQHLIEFTNHQDIIVRQLADLSPLDTWHTSNIILIGDAAHATTPNMGQGAAQGIEDAFYLSQLLKQNSDISQAFEKFEAKRFKKANAIVRNSRMLGNIAHIKRGQKLRNALMRMASSSIADQQMIKTYTVTPLS